MDFKGRSIISAKDFSREEFLYVIDLAAKFKRTKTGYVGTGIHRSRLLEGKSVALLFLEPSTRTIFSFSAAAQRLGASTAYSDLKTSYYGRGGFLEQDIDLFMALKSDVIVLRHPESCSAQSALDSVNSLAELVGVAQIPIINAGDGTNEHPTQSFLDLYTIMEEKGTLDGLKIGIFGDLLNGRTVHSLSYALSNFDVEVYFVSNNTLKMPDGMLDELKAAGLKYHEAPISDLSEIIRKLDVGYATRIQKERFASEEEYERVKNLYVIDNKMLQRTKKDFLLMHPLPRITEIAYDVDRNPKAAYFRQVENGLPVRQALLSLVLGAIK